MEHQDWNPVIMNSKNHTEAKETNETNAKKTIQSQRIADLETTRLEAPKQLGQLISQARTTKVKTQKTLATELGVSPQILGRWEANKEIPTNAQIAKIERVLGIKLPRCKKVAAKEIG